MAVTFRSVNGVVSKRGSGRDYSSVKDLVIQALDNDPTGVEFDVAPVLRHCGLPITEYVINGFYASLSGHAQKMTKETGMKHRVSRKGDTFQFGPDKDEVAHI